MGPKCVKIEPVTEIDKLMYKYCVHERQPGFIEVGEDKICMPVHYESIADRIDNFEVRDSDVFIVSHPRAGTTWTQEMVWMITNNMDFKGANSSLLERSPYLELQGVINFEQVLELNPKARVPAAARDSVHFTMKCPNNPRIIKSHLPWSLLPKQLRENVKKSKIIYVARNPKDLIVSFYHHWKSIGGVTADFETFQKLFMAGRLIRGPYWKNVLGYWERRNQENIIFIKFEDMKKDLSSVIKLVADFLGKQMDGNQISELVEHLDFQNMKNSKNYSVQKVAEVTGSNLTVTDKSEHLRSGNVGGYKTEMTLEMIKTFDEWTEENIRETGLSFE